MATLTQPRSCLRRLDRLCGCCPVPWGREVVRRDDPPVWMRLPACWVLRPDAAAGLTWAPAPDLARPYDAGVRRV